MCLNEVTSTNSLTYGVIKNYLFCQTLEGCNKNKDFYLLFFWPIVLFWSPKSAVKRCCWCILFIIVSSFLEMQLSLNLQRWMKVFSMSNRNNNLICVRSGLITYLLLQIRVQSFFFQSLHFACIIIVKNENNILFINKNVGNVWKKILLINNYSH